MNHSTARRGFAQPAFPGCFMMIFVLLLVGGGVTIFALWPTKTTPPPVVSAGPSAPQRIVAKSGEAPVLAHGRQTLVVPPGVTGCIKPAIGDSQVNFNTRESAETRRKGLVRVKKECDVGPGIWADARPGRYDCRGGGCPTYSFQVVNESAEVVPVDVDSW